MKKWSRFMFFALPAFLSLFAGIFADSLTRYVINLLPWPDRPDLGMPVLIIGLIFLVMGIILIFSLTGAHIDSFQTRTKLIIATILTGLGAGWVWSGFVLVSNFL